MDKPEAITRRRALIGLAGTLAVATAASVATATAAPMKASTVLSAIDAHKEAVRAIWRLLRRADDLERTPGRPPSPEVCVGNLIGWNAEGERTRTPIMASSHKTISEHCDQQAQSPLWPKAQAAVRERFAGIHRDLTRQIRARARFDRRTGFAAVQAEILAAYVRADELAAGVLLALPTNATEAAAKARYLKRQSLMHDWETCPVTYRTVMRGLCAINGEA